MENEGGGFCCVFVRSGPGGGCCLGVDSVYKVKNPHKVSFLRPGGREHPSIATQASGAPTFRFSVSLLYI